MKESDSLNDQYVSILLEKQVKKIIADNQGKDPYFSIRQIFDLDQFVWSIATDIYKSSGYQIDLVKTKQLILEHQSSAWSMYQQEQEKVRQENIRIQEELEEQEKLRQENIRIKKECIKECIQNIPELEGSTVKGKVYFCLTEIIAEDSETNVNEITWNTNFEEYLTNEEYLSRMNICEFDKFDNFFLFCAAFIMDLEEILDIEITDEDSEKYLTTVGSFTNYIISRFQDNPDELERRITEYLLNEK